MSDDVTATITEDQALSLVHDFRSRFHWSGTEFMRSDVADHVRDAWAERRPNEPLTPERLDELVDVVMGGYTYRKLADRFAELGNELLTDRAVGAVDGDLDDI